MPADHHRQQTVDRLVASVRETAEASLRSYAEAVADASAEEARRDAAAHVAHLIGRDVIAVLYADAAPRDAETVPDWCLPVEILARYTGRVLESLTIRLALDARTAHAAAGVPSGSSPFSGGIR